MPPKIITELNEPSNDGEVIGDDSEINLAHKLPFLTMEFEEDSD
jgi:hypothetical protein